MVEAELAAALVGGALASIGTTLLWRAHLREREQRIGQLNSALSRSKRNWEAVQDMRATWNGRGLEDPCRDLLYKNMWVLEPEYALEVGRFFCNETLRQVFRELKIDAPEGRHKSHYLLERLAEKHDPLSWRPDICGFVSKLRGVGHPSAYAGGKTFLIIELKKPRDTISTTEIDQAYTYASLFRRLQTEGNAWTIPIECLVVGRDFDAGAHEVYSRWGNHVSHAITVRPMRYQDLVARAEALCGISVEEQPTHSAEAANENDLEGKSVVAAE